MVTMTIRNLDDDAKARVRVRAARHGRSTEEEARNILRAARDIDSEVNTGTALLKAARALVERSGGIEWESPSRE